MTIAELVTEGLIPKDHWLTKARVQNEDVVIDDGVVIWYGGTWYNGIWKGGIWKRGTWEDGTWKGGTWYGGTWYNGIWKGGTWYGGIWYNGIWKGGTWYGGIWEDGIWKDGTWKGGIWYGGQRAFGQCRWQCLFIPGGDLIQIGCVTKTVKEWEKWLEGDEEYTTKRSDPAFKDIELSIREGILLTRLYRENK